jgi:radical SAM superfamily enzyme YgiQ (UPF0313 family)
VTGPLSPISSQTADICCTPTEPTAASVDATTPRLRVLLISTYELGHQPFGLASPAAWLRSAGRKVTCADLAREALDEVATRRADLIAFYLPMHTATRLASQVIPRVRAINPSAHLCAYGLYAPVNADMLRGLGVHTIMGGEFEVPLTELAAQLAGTAPRRELPLISLDRQQFHTPDRTGLPPLGSYATLRLPGGADRVVGYTEATRGCKHLCRHCPIVPVYGGRFRVVQRDVVLTDIDRQVAAGAEHITFGDPDFLNGPAHAIGLVEQLHARHPAVTYDVTIKVEHLVKHATLLPTLSRTGCLLVTSAVEAFAPQVLEVFDKQHTRDDVVAAVALLRDVGIALNPTFVAFSPWTSREAYLDFLTTIHELRLIGNVSPVQYAIRLLIIRGSRLLEVPDIGDYLGDFDPDGLCYRWTHPDPMMDELQRRLFDLVETAVAADEPRAKVFRRICERTAEVLGGQAAQRLDRLDQTGAVHMIPSLSESWYCCAEPIRNQLEPLL